MNQRRRATDHVAAEAPSESLSRRDAAERQNRVLLKAWQTAHPVLYQGVRRHIHTLMFQKPGGNPEVVVYLIGEIDPVPPAELTPCPDFLHTQIGAAVVEVQAAQPEAVPA